MATVTENIIEKISPVVKSIKNFRSQDDVETFYRFVNDNGLREEAKKIMQFVVEKLAPPKKTRKKRGRKKIH